MTVRTLDSHIEMTPGVAGGRPRVAGRRIRVQDIVIWHERLGRSADELVEGYGLTLAEIYAALAYYYDHQDEIDQAILRDDELVDRLSREIPSKFSRGANGSHP
ncbi:MAG: DUF433 domain-containing protein [Gemmataceae bacterium]|nr:DUF433 domain-containing protein [Gemmataceae bacterium]